MFNKSIQISIASLLIASVTAWAAPSSTLEGTVKDSNGGKVAGAEIHIKSKDGATSKIVRSDANGHYVCTGLPVGTYETILFVNGSIKAQINNTATNGNKPTELNFSLTGKMTANNGKKHTHMVYVPPATGSHMGGRWVEVDDNGHATTAGADNLDTVDGSALKNSPGNMLGGRATGGH